MQIKTTLEWTVNDDFSVYVYGKLSISVKHFTDNEVTGEFEFGAVEGQYGINRQEKPTYSTESLLNYDYILCREYFTRLMPLIPYIWNMDYYGINLGNYSKEELLEKVTPKIEELEKHLRAIESYDQIMQQYGDIINIASGYSNILGSVESAKQDLEQRRQYVQDNPDAFRDIFQ